MFTIELVATRGCSSVGAVTMSLEGWTFAMGGRDETCCLGIFE